MSGIQMPILGIYGYNTISSLNQLPNLSAGYVSDPANATNFGTNIPTNGGGVKTWSDSAAALHDANQSVGNKQPTWNTNILNSRATIRFDGSNDLLSINPSSFLQGKTGATMFVVAKSLTLSGTPVMMTTDQNGYKIAWSTTYNVGFAGGSATSTVVGDTTNYHLFTLIFDGTYTNAGDITDQNNGRLKFRYDKTAQPLTFTVNVNSQTAGTGTYVYFGTDATGGANFWNGEIAQVAYYTRALSAGEVLLVEEYLSGPLTWNFLT